LQLLLLQVLYQRLLPASLLSLERQLLFVLLVVVSLLLLLGPFAAADVAAHVALLEGLAQALPS
jgi:hypothetical protein